MVHLVLLFLGQVLVRLVYVVNQLHGVLPCEALDCFLQTLQQVLLVVLHCLFVAIVVIVTIVLNEFLLLDARMLEDLRQVFLIYQKETVLDLGILESLEGDHL